MITTLVLLFKQIDFDFAS